MAPLHLGTVDIKAFPFLFFFCCYPELLSAQRPILQYFQVDIIALNMYSGRTFELR
jgi:hypothetical protein